MYITLIVFFPSAKEGIVDCRDLPKGSRSGVYTTVYKFDVYCEMNSTGSGWTVNIVLFNYSFIKSLFVITRFDIV